MDENKFATKDGLFFVFIGVCALFGVLGFALNVEFKENRVTSKEHTILLNTLLKKVDSLEIKLDSLER